MQAFLIIEIAYIEALHWSVQHIEVCARQQAARKYTLEI